ncbi:MAG: hypothetical protein HY075_07095 [Deltaproteobacteria bacterium]|nr:hypothetical protein [Deltaproteobacteria bacterium]
MIRYRSARIAAAVVTLLWLLAADARAWQLEEFYRGTRAMGMGGAYTAVADDADSVFYNPAGLALNSNYEFRLINPKIDLSTDDIGVVSDLRAAATKLDGPTLTKLFGQHIYGDVGVFPVVYFPGVALGYYYNAQTHIVSRNLAFPQIEASYTKDNGVVGGIGHEFKGFAKRQFLRAGVSVKWLSRQGFRQTIPLSKLVTADKTYLTSLTSASATGWGATPGIQYEIGLDRSNELLLGTAWQDIGDMTFGNDLQANRPPPVRSNLSAGMAFVHRFSPTARATNNFKLSAEVRHLTQTDVDPRLRLHAGAELQVGSVSLQAGIAQDSLCLGAKLDMFFLEVSAVTYGVENQSVAFMDREQRYMLQLTLKFDVMGKQKPPERDEDRRKHPRSY